MGFLKEAYEARKMKAAVKAAIFVSAGIIIGAGAAVFYFEGLFKNIESANEKLLAEALSDEGREALRAFSEEPPDAALYAQQRLVQSVRRMTMSAEGKENLLRIEAIAHARIAHIFEKSGREADARAEYENAVALFRESGAETTAGELRSLVRETRP